MSARMLGRAISPLLCTLLAASALFGPGCADGAADPDQAESPGLIVGVPQGTLSASDAALDDDFGRSIAISGDTAVIGAPGIFDDTPRYGAAYVFAREGGAWREVQRLVPGARRQDDRFGETVGISGNDVIVGAVGAAHVFTLEGDSVTEQALTPSEGDTFGEYMVSVAISGDTAVVGASDAAFVFLRSGGAFAQARKLVPGPGSGFTSVALDGDTLVLYGYEGATGLSRVAYVFVAGGDVWDQQAALRAQEPSELVSGDPVAIDGDTVLIGAPYVHEGHPASGAAYVFARTGGAWAEQQLVPVSFDDVGMHDPERDSLRLGISVALSGDLLVLGSVRGHARVFARHGTAWEEQPLLEVREEPPSPYLLPDFYPSGQAVALSGNTALALDPPSDAEGGRPGSVSAFVLASSEGSPCEADAACASGACVSGTCTIGDHPERDPGCHIGDAAPSSPRAAPGLLFLLGLGLLAARRRCLAALAALSMAQVSCGEDCFDAYGGTLVDTTELSFLPGRWVGNFHSNNAFLSIDVGTDNHCVFEYNNLTAFIFNQPTPNDEPCHYAVQGACRINMEVGDQNADFELVFCSDPDTVELLGPAVPGGECAMILATQREGYTSVSLFRQRSDTELVASGMQPFVLYKQ